MCISESGRVDDCDAIVAPFDHFHSRRRKRNPGVQGAHRFSQAFGG